jgi:hypothetical protein
MAVFWVVAPCSLAEVYQRFRGSCYNPEDSHIHHDIILHCDLYFQNTQQKHKNLYLRLICAVPGAVTKEQLEQAIDRRCIHVVKWTNIYESRQWALFPAEANYSPVL